MVERLVRRRQVPQAAQTRAGTLLACIENIDCVYWGLIDDLADLEASDKEGCGPRVQDPTTRKWSLGWAQDQRQRQRKRAKKKKGHGGGPGRG